MVKVLVDYYIYLTGFNLLDINSIINRNVYFVCNVIAAPDIFIRPGFHVKPPTNTWHEKVVSDTGKDRGQYPAANLKCSNI